MPPSFEFAGLILPVRLVVEVCGRWAFACTQALFRGVRRTDVYCPTTPILVSEVVEKGTIA
jgi:hypothetical protein